MSLTIKDYGESFEYKGKKFKWINNLLNFYEQDFNDLKGILEFKKINEKTIYLDLFQEIFEYKTKSIYFELLKNSLINFSDFYDDYINSDNSTSYNPKKQIYKLNLPVSTNVLPFPEDLQVLFQSLFFSHTKVKRIIDTIILINEKKRVPESKKNSTNIANFSTNNMYYHSIILKYDEEIPNSIFYENGKYIYQTTFHTVEEFCFYSLQKLFNYGIIIKRCNYNKCNKIFIPSHKLQKYCSEQCRMTQNSDFTKQKEKNNKFYGAYRTKLKNLTKKYETNQNNPYAFDKLKKLYKEYKKYDNTPLEEEKFNEFKKKLKLIK